MATSEPISFPDPARSDLESTIEQLVAQAQRVLATQGRLRSLLRANRLVVEELELTEVLRHIVEAAVDLVDAQYGALGVIGPDGRLEQFIHVGVTEEDAEAIGELPRGHGILGAVIDDAMPIRLEHLGDDPRAVGFPPHHPAMEGFLGVPIRVRGEVYGNLYLTSPVAGAFSAEDEELVGVLAGTAGIAIENARLFDAALRREKWGAALTDVSSALLSGEADTLLVVVEHVAALVEADLVAVVVERNGSGVLSVAAARGEGAPLIHNRLYRAEGTLVGRALASGAPVLADRQEPDEMVEGQPAFGPTFVLPLEASGHTIGALSISRRLDAAPFSVMDLAMATEFGAQASVALEVARGRSDREQLELFDDRSRIARDLHDHVIQRLFGAGLSLQSVAGRAPAGIQETILAQVETIDAAISEIRTVVFALSSTVSAADDSLRHRLLDIVSEAGSNMFTPPRLAFSGPVDLLVRGLLADDVTAVVRESLVNVARHAEAANCEVDVTVDDDELRVRIQDDGVGFVAGSRSSGTANLAARAERLGGSYSIEGEPGRGTAVLWRVPAAAWASP